MNKQEQSHELWIGKLHRMNLKERANMSYRLLGVLQGVVKYEGNQEIMRKSVEDTVTDILGEKEA